MDSGLRMMGIGFRQALQFTESERKKEQALILKQRGIMRRIVDKNSRMSSAAYNKMMEVWKQRQNEAKEKLKFIIAALTDSDKAFILCAYNGLKQRCMMLNGVGMGDAEMKKISLIKRLTNQGHNFQVMGINSLKEFLVYERQLEEKRREQYEREQKEKDRILRRIMDGNLRMMGTGFRQALQFTESEREKERVLINKQRGIMRRIVDSNTRLMSAGYNKLVEEWKSKQNSLKEKLRFVIATLTDND